METVVWKNEIGQAADVIRSSGLVAVPTETVYGLAGNGLDPEAVARIYEVKGRPAVKPLSLMVSGAEDISRLCTDVPLQAYALAERFWPGPLTIVLPAREEIPEIVLAGGKTVGLRCPDSELTRQLIREAGLPLAAPSANPSGEPSPKTADEVLGYFNGAIEAVIDGGICMLGTESTLIDLSAMPFRILRRGALPEEEVADALAEAMLVIGITGTTGSGKTTVLSWLEKKGAFVLDCDALYHEMLHSHGSMLAALREHFPDAFTPEGELDRKRLAACVFSDPESLRELNAVTHRFIGEGIRSKLRHAAMEGRSLAAIDAVELISAGAGELCNHTVAVLADRGVRAERIMARDGISREEAERRIDAQKPDRYYEENCELLLRNDADAESLINECENKLGGWIRHG